MKILVVEDDPRVRFTTVEWLNCFFTDDTNIDYKVDQACDGDSAIEACRKETYDYVILDMILKNKRYETDDIIEVIDSILEKLPDVKIIVMSGYVENGLVKQIRDDGKVDQTIFFKPVDIDELATYIIEQHNERKQR